MFFGYVTSKVIGHWSVMPHGHTVWRQNVRGTNFRVFEILINFAETNFADAVNVTPNA